MIDFLMGLWARTGRLSKALLLITAGAAGGGAAIAVASVPDSNGVIHACYNVGSNGEPAAGATLTVIDPSAGQSCNTSGPAGAAPTQRQLNWNVQGPPGAQGPPGQPGPQGAPGNTATVVQGQKLTLPGGEVITVGGSGGAPVPPAGGGVVGEASMGTGRGASTFAIHGFSFGTSQGGTSGSSSSGAGAGKVKIHDISITKGVDSSSPKLILACASGQHFKTVTVTLKKKKTTYLVIKMSDVLISSFQTSSKGNSSPRDALSLNFTKIELQYKAQSANGKAPPVTVVKVLHQ